MVVPRPAGAPHGFSLVELLVVIAILGILMSLATLPFQELIANQRVKSVTSDLVADLAMARSEAIKRSARVGIAHLGATGAPWTGGWQVFHDADRDGQFDRDADNSCTAFTLEECFFISRPALDASVKVCDINLDVNNSIDVLTFGADGKVRTYKNGVEQNVRGIVISSTLISPSVPPRMLEFSPSGRVTVVTGVPRCD